MKHCTVTGYQETNALPMLVAQDKLANILLNIAKHVYIFRPVPSFTCNTNCSCDPMVFTPVCGSDRRNYYSPCYAGCQNESRIDAKTVTYF